MYRCTRKGCTAPPSAHHAGWGSYTEHEPGSTPKLLCPSCSRTYVSGRKRVPDPDDPTGVKQVIVNVAHESDFRWL